MPLIPVQWRRCFRAAFATDIDARNPFTAFAELSTAVSRLWRLAKDSRGDQRLFSFQQFLTPLLMRSQAYDTARQPDDLQLLRYSGACLWDHMAPVVRKFGRTALERLNEEDRHTGVGGGRSTGTGNRVVFSFSDKID